MPSTIAPVPSGEASSTTRISSEGSCARIAGISRAMLKRSLYVGTMTSARSGKSSPVTPNSRPEHQQSQRDRQPGDRLSPLVRWACEIQLDSASTGWKLNAYKRDVSPTDSSRFSVGERNPPWVIILRNHERGSFGGGRTQVDLYLAWLVMPDRCRDCEWSWKRLNYLSR